MAKVLVTGASGFIALHCIDQLLKAGHHVRGTLRTMSRGQEVRDAVSEQGDVLKFTYADLTGDDGWAEAVEGCEYVLHTASPLPNVEIAHEDELILPARDGTIRVLTAAKAAGVKRVVLTSSIAAVKRGSKKPKSHMYSGADWTVIENVDPYSKSKTIAERAAWKFSETEGLELATILPGQVLGPLLSPDGSSSVDLVTTLLTGFSPIVPPLGLNPVDVRDVAAAHVAAMTAPDATGSRFICVTEACWMRDMAKILAREYRPKGWKIPTRGIPLWAGKIMANFHPRLKQAKQFLEAGHNFDTRNVHDMLGVELRGLEEMTLASAESMIELGVVEKG